MVKTEVGYTQGTKKNPTYEEVCSGSTGHTEAVQVTFDPNAIKFEDLLEVFFDITDTTTLNRQGNDVGTQYRSGIYYHNDAQKMAAYAACKREQTKHTEKIVVEIMPASDWWSAEDYHQQYLAKGGQCPFTGDLTPIRCYG